MHSNTEQVITQNQERKIENLEQRIDQASEFEIDVKLDSGNGKLGLWINVEVEGKQITLEEQMVS